ncbi:MAG: radical SAM protein [Tissierellia bacterium]|nr:radical SAM protein [Tissierellia bacterium]
MQRYSKITEKNPREIALLKSYPCNWGRCAFCDYIKDNSKNFEELIKTNSEVLKKIDGKFKKLEIINSGSVFELPKETIEEIKRIAIKKNIEEISFETHYNYIEEIKNLKKYFSPIKLKFKCGIETFDEEFRNKVLKKGFKLDIEKAKESFDQICLLIGIKGQTKEMIDKDINLALKNFNRICINIYIENSTAIKRDEEIINYFLKKYKYLEENPKVEILLNNTDFGVGD